MTMTIETIVNKTENRGRPSKLPEMDVFATMYENHSNAALAEMYGVTVSTIQKAARRNGMKKTETGRPCFAPDVAELVELCKHHTDKEVAELFSVCPGTVAYWRKRANITKYNKTV